MNKARIKNKELSKMLMEQCKKIFYHTHPIQKLFFEALYKTREKD